MSGKRNWGDNMTDRRDKHVAPPVIESARPLPSKAWKKKYKCKKNKGDHSWYIESIHCRMEYTGKGIWGTFFSTRPTPDATEAWARCTVEWRCSACNKHDTEWLTERPGGRWDIHDKKKDPFRPHSPMVK